MFYVIKGKKIIKFLSLFVIVIGLVFIFGTNGDNPQVVQTSSSNKQKTVVLDAGHGQPDRSVQ